MFSIKFTICGGSAFLHLVDHTPRFLNDFGGLYIFLEGCCNLAKQFSRHVIYNTIRYSPFLILATAGVPELL